MKSIILWDMTPCSLLSFNNELYGVISQKMILFINTAVKTSNPTGKKIILILEGDRSFHDGEGLYWIFRVVRSVVL
jgi:hypothetical protein